MEEINRPLAFRRRVLFADVIGAAKRIRPGDGRTGFARRMTFTQRIPADRLLGLDVHDGDTLQLLAQFESFFVR